MSADRSPATAWEEAKAHGSLPIQMWAERPKAVPLDDLVASRDKLKAWFGDIDKVVVHLRLNARSAESYRASMAGHLGFLLQQANDRQKALLAQKPVDAVGNFKQALAEKANAEKEPLVAEIASDKQTMAEVQAIFDKAKEDMAPLDAAFATLAADFAAYRKTEADEAAVYAALAKEASAAGLDTIDGVEQSILEASLAASGKPNDLTLAALKLSAELTGLLQLQPLCAKSSVSWRAAGCALLGNRFKAMATEAKTTLPGQITTGIAVMRDKGVDGALLDAAQAKLLGGDVKGAAILHDAALRGAEGT